MFTPVVGIRAQVSLYYIHCVQVGFEKAMNMITALQRARKGDNLSKIDCEYAYALRMVYIETATKQACYEASMLRS